MMQSGTTRNLTGVWGSSPTDVFAIGGNGTILHFDGRHWTRMSVPGEPDLISIWGSSGRDVHAVGDRGVILHFDGQTWTALPSGVTTKPHRNLGQFRARHFRRRVPRRHPAQGSPALLTRVWGTGPQDVYAVGFDGVLLHYEGKSWASRRCRVEPRKD